MTWDLGVWSIDQGVVDWIKSRLPKGSTILELGSGEGTGALAEAGFKMLSIEHDPAFLDKQDSTYIYAPIRGDWYGVAPIRAALEGRSYDLILIDGPIKTQTTNRTGFLRNLDLFRQDVPMVFDDTQRASELTLAREVHRAVAPAKFEQIPCTMHKRAVAVIPERKSDV